MENFPLIRYCSNKSLKSANFVTIPKPLEDERLSSWIVRVSLAHKTYPITFINLYLSERFFSAHTDVDITYTDEFLMRLAKKSGYATSDIYKMTLNSYEGRLFKELQKNGSLYLIEKLNSKKHSYGIKFCPTCLKSDKNPYWRRSWRLSFYNVCEHHNNFMENQCNKCGSKIDFFHSNDITLCKKCGFDIRNTISTTLTCEYEYAQEALRYFMNALQTGVVFLGEHQIYSFHYFEVFKRFLLLLRSDALLTLECFPLHSTSKELLKTHKLNSDMQSIQTKALVYASIYHILKDFPKNFVSFIKQNKINHYDLKMDMGVLPMWYQNAIDLFAPPLSMRGKEVTKVEIKNIIDHLKRNNRLVNKKTVSSLLGCKIPRKFWHNVHFNAQNAPSYP